MVRRHKFDEEKELPVRELGNPNWKFPLAVAVALFLLQLFFSANSWSGPIFRASVRAVATSIMNRLAAAVAETDLAFMEGAPGSPPEVVAPSDPNALRFSISGEENQAYYVSFPKVLEVSLNGSKEGTTDPDQVVKIYDVNSSSLSNGVLPADGSAVRAALGGTRDQLRVSQETGEYSGEMPLTIVYP